MTRSGQPVSRVAVQPQQRLWIGVYVLYVAAVVCWLIFTHSFPEPDVIAIFLLAFAFLAARAFRFLRDWSVFILLLLGYVFLTGIVPGLEARAHVQFPIDADRSLFHGVLPTAWLQSHLWHGSPRWYDCASTFLYDLHFVAPLVVAFTFWLWRPEWYWRFVGAYLLLCYAGFLTYLLYPMAPPWWAADLGRLSHVQQLLTEIRYQGIENPIVFATRYFQPNPVAAMPSLHAGFPVLVWLALWRAFPRWGWVAVAYPLGMAFAVVYLGDHYVVDVLAGWLYAAVAFALVCLPVSRPLRTRLRRRQTRTSGTSPDVLSGAPVSAAISSGE
jgi:membrane-associated phospholipid phosphatase